MPKIEVSIGEVIDKITILKIKMEYITDSIKIDYISLELDILTKSIKDVYVDKCLIVDECLIYELYLINKKIWKVENIIRDLENKKMFNEKFIENARLDASLNDQRFVIKNKINNKYESLIKEQKSYDGLYTPN